MAVLQYGPCIFPYTNITSFQQEAVYDDVAGIDHILTRFDITAQTIVNNVYMQQLLSDIANAEAVNNYWAPSSMSVMLRDRLLQPRQALSVKFNGIELMPKNQNSNVGKGTTDAKNGPIPKSITILDLPNNSYLIQFHIVAHYWENLDAGDIDTHGTNITNKNAGMVLFNRWTETIDIDYKNLSVKTREGKFAIRSDNTAGILADSIRPQMAVLSIPEGFVRESAKYVISPDGLAIAYRITDREVYLLPPKPAFRAKGKYTESSTVGQAVRYAHIDITLEADNYVQRADLIQTALNIAQSKINEKTFTVLQFTAVQMELWENTVTVSAKAMMNALDTMNRTQAQLNFDFATLPGASRIIDPPAMRDRGTGDILLQAAAYFDPSLLQNPLIAGRFSTTEASALTNQNNGKVNIRGNANNVEPGEGGLKREP